MKIILMSESHKKIEQLSQIYFFVYVVYDWILKFGR